LLRNKQAPQLLQTYTQQTLIHPTTVVSSLQVPSLLPAAAGLYVES
jgi:hypothetical protein